MTTGRVSHVIKKLERRIGAPLFDRTSRVVRPTPIGARLDTDLRPLVTGIEDAVQRATQAGRAVTGQLRVAFVGETLAPVMLRSVALFSARHPDCDVDVRDVSMVAARSTLLAGDADVIIAAFPFDGGINGPALMLEQRVLAVPAGHTLAGHAAVTLEVLGDHPVVQYPNVLSAAFRQDRTPDRDGARGSSPGLLVEIPHPVRW